MIRRLLFLTLIAAVIALALRTFVVEGIYVASASMEPTLRVGTFLFLDKASYRFRAPRHGEIVVFPSPVDGRKDLIKRIVALGGDTLEIRDKRVYLNGKKLDENYVQYTRSQERLMGDDLGPFTVPEGMAFVMGDNRDESGDSRDWKDPVTGNPIYFIALTAVKGRILQLN